MLDFRWIVVRCEKKRVRIRVSWDLPWSLQYLMIGSDAAIPWFPLPLVVITGSEHPLILASPPAEAKLAHLFL